MAGKRKRKGKGRWWRKGEGKRRSGERRTQRREVYRKAKEIAAFSVVVAHGVLQQRVLLGGPLARGRLSPRRRRRHAQPRRVHGRVEPGRRLRGQQEWRELWPRRRGGGVWLPRPSANSGQWARARPNATTRLRVVSSWFRSGRGLAPKRLTKIARYLSTKKNWEIKPPPQQEKAGWGWKIKAKINHARYRGILMIHGWHIMEERIFPPAIASRPLPSVRIF